MAQEETSNRHLCLSGFLRGALRGIWGVRWTSPSANKDSLPSNKRKGFGTSFRPSKNFKYTTTKRHTIETKENPLIPNTGTKCSTKLKGPNEQAPHSKGKRSEGLTSSLPSRSSFENLATHRCQFSHHTPLLAITALPKVREASVHCKLPILKKGRNLTMQVYLQKTGGRGGRCCQSCEKCERRRGVPRSPCRVAFNSGVAVLVWTTASGTGGSSIQPRTGKEHH